MQPLLGARILLPGRYMYMCVQYVYYYYGRNSIVLVALLQYASPFTCSGAGSGLQELVNQTLHCVIVYMYVYYYMSEYLTLINQIFPPSYQVIIRYTIVHL